MPDPFEIFAGGSETRQRMLQTGWPDLFHALNRPVLAAGGGGRVRPCEILSRHPGATDRPPAIGRLLVNGRAACAACLAYLLPGRPGGFPLEMIDPRSVKK